MSGVVVSERSRARSPQPATRLDEQELELIRLLADGLVLDAIARRLSVSERTLRRRIRALCDRFGVETPVQVVVWAARNGVL
jgi:DNA-binding NarL/FixJ family response regulator